MQQVTLLLRNTAKTNRDKTQTEAQQTVPCQSNTEVPLQMTGHSEIQTVSWCQSRELHPFGHDPTDPLNCPPSERYPTNESAHEFEILSHVHGLDRGQTLALSQLKYMSLMLHSHS